MSKAKSSAGCGILFCSVFLLAGVALIAGAWNKRETERNPGALYAMVATGLVFTAVGGGLILSLRKAISRERETAALRAQFPAEPWHWRRDWHERRIHPGNESGLAAIWLFAVVWNGISAPAAVAVWPKLAREPVLWLVMMFPAIGLLVLWSALYQTVRARKFGRPAFESESLPGAIGGYLAGVIRVPARIALERDARLRLVCLRRTVTGSGKNRSVREAALWETEARVAREKWQSGLGGTHIPVLLYIAPDCAPTEMDADPDNRVLWRLSAEAAVPGVDFAATFEVPVFATGKAEPPPAPGLALLEEYRATALDAEALAAAGVRHERAGGHESFEFTASHVTGTKFVTGFVAVALLAVAVRLAVGKAPWIATAAVLFFDLFAWMAATDLWAGRIELRIERDDLVVVRHGWLRTTETRVRRRDAGDVRTKESMSYGERKFFRLVLIGSPGIDPRSPGPAEPFRARKLRYLLKRAERATGAPAPDILREMAQTPKFELQLARHLPGLATAEAVGGLVLERVCGDNSQPG